MKKRQVNGTHGTGKSLFVEMLRLLIVFWMIPYILLSLVFYLTYFRRDRLQVENTVTASAENAAETSLMNLNRAYEASLQASYDGEIRAAWEKFLKDGDEYDMYGSVTDYLNRTYKYSNLLSNTIVIFTSPDVRLDYYTYSNVAGATYRDVREFKQTAADAVREAASSLDTGVVLVSQDGHLYLVRNLVEKNYVPFAVLVNELNMDKLFEGADSVVFQEASEILVDENNVRSTEGDSRDVSALYEQLVLDENLSKNQTGRAETMAGYNRSLMMAWGQCDFGKQTVTFMYRLNHRDMLSEQHYGRTLLILSFLLLIPILIGSSILIKKDVTEPIDRLVNEAGNIAAGRYGTTIEEFHGNREIATLTDTFNRMSRSLDYSFNTILADEVAMRDARLKALQSQINPHFLNNTLEIINWKARMAGAEDVSEMIEALSVVMNATLDRNNEPFVEVREEMEYVEAYLTIIRERFGDKFSFTEDVAPELMGFKIPRLIIQPVLENVVEHGRDEKGKISGRLKIYRESLRDGDIVFIVVENSGQISDEDEQRIQGILDGKIEPQSHTRIGIRNTDQRLKLIYGGTSGLTIRRAEDGHTVCTLTMDLTGKQGQENSKRLHSFFDNSKLQ